MDIDEALNDPGLRAVRRNATVSSTDLPAMPPDFELKYPRRIRSSGWFPQPDGQMVHITGYKRLTPEDEANYRQSDPENGLHPDDVQAFRASVNQSPALWHRAREVDPNVGWRAVRISARRIWSTFEDHCHGVVNRSKRDLARLAHWLRR